MILNILLIILTIILIGFIVGIIIIWRKYGKELSTTLKEIKNLSTPKGFNNTKELLNDFNDALKTLKNLDNKNGKRF